MEQLVNVKQPQIGVFVPLPKLPRRSVRKCYSGLASFRDLLAPYILNPCSTLATVILVIVEGVLIFLYLLLDVTIQDSLRILTCGNATSVMSGRYTVADIENDLKRPMQYTSTVLLTAFLMEVFIRTFVSGRRRWRDYWEIFDATVVIIAFAINITLLSSFSVGKQVSQFIILFRLWRVLELLGAPLSKQHCIMDDSSSYLEKGLSASSSITTADTYVAEQSVATLMLKIEELERELDRMRLATNLENSAKACDQKPGKFLPQTNYENVNFLRQRPITFGLQEQKLTENGPTQPKCHRCVNHNWTTDDLLKMASMQLSGTELKFKDDMRAAKSLEDLSLPESGYSSAQRRARAVRYPVDGYLEKRPLELAVQLETTATGQRNEQEWLAELLEIQRISQINCPDVYRKDLRIPVTSL